MTLKKALSSRSKGDYSKSTLKLFEKVWQDDPTLESFVAFLSFQRDTGKILSKQQYEYLIDNYLEKDKRPNWFEFKLKWQLQNLCLEYEHHYNIQACRLNKGVKSPGILPLPWQRDGVTLIREQQKSWRIKWLEELSILAKDGIAVVGNSATLDNKSQGEDIDRHAAVIRFNQPITKPGYKRHFGSNTHTRVIAPNYRGPIPACDWIVISGPDMQYQLQNWTHLMPALKRGSAIITIPIQYWASLVKLLEAPPSAGVLVLNYLRNQPSLMGNIKPFGFGYSFSKEQTYHAADSKHLASTRHNWDAEAKAINQWFSK